LVDLARRPACRAVVAHPHAGSASTYIDARGASKVRIVEYRGSVRSGRPAREADLKQI
jgi:hypothetical protein